MPVSRIADHTNHFCDPGKDEDGCRDGKKQPNRNEQSGHRDLQIAIPISR